MNLVMTGNGQLVEVQATAEGAPFSQEEFEVLLSLGNKGISELVAFQKNVLGDLAQRIEGCPCPDLVLASRNKGKLAELKALLAGLPGRSPPGGLSEVPAVEEDGRVSARMR